MIEWHKAENELKSVGQQAKRKRLPGAGRKVIYTDIEESFKDLD